MARKSTKPTYESIMEHYDSVLTEHEQNRNVWQDLADLVVLNRRGFTGTVPVGEEQTERCFDSTAPNASDALASFIGGNMVSRIVVWPGLRFRSEELNDIDEAKEWLERQNVRLVRAYNQSNLYGEIHATFRDLTGLDTAVLFNPDRDAKGRPGFPGLQYHALPLADCVIDVDADEKVDTVFRNYSVSLRAYVRKWGEEGLGKNARRALSQGKLSKILNCRHAVFPRDPEFVAQSENPEATAMPWASYYIDLEDKVILRETGFMEFPFMVPRWDTLSGQKYGFGRGHLSLPHVRVLNKAVEMGLEAEALAIRPPTKSLNGAIRGGLNTTPAANTVLDSMDGLAPLFPPGHLREALDSKRITVSDIRQDVRAMFYADQITIPIGPMMTAFEFAKRIESTQRIVGPALGRVETELLTPLVRRAFAIMLRDDGFEEPPQVVLEHEDNYIDVEYQGPLAKNQRLSEIEGTERWIALMTSLAQFMPDIFDNAEGDEIARSSADILGVPGENVTDMRKMAQLRAARVQQQQEAAEAEGLRQDAVAAGKAAPILGLMGGAQQRAG